MVMVTMGTLRLLPCQAVNAAEISLAPPSGHVQGGGGVREGGGAPPMPLLRLPHPHRGLFLPLQRERLKNIERICCLLRKVSVRVEGRRLLAQLSPRLCDLPCLGPV